MLLGSTSIKAVRRTLVKLVNWRKGAIQIIREIIRDGDKMSHDFFIILILRLSKVLSYVWDFQRHIFLLHFEVQRLQVWKFTYFLRNVTCCECQKSAKCHVLFEWPQREAFWWHFYRSSFKCSVSLLLYRQV